MSRIRAANLESLPIHHHVLYEIVRSAGSIKPGDLHSTYDTVSATLYDGRRQTPICRRDRRRKLAKLAEYELVDEADSRHDCYEVYDAGVASDIVNLP